MSVASERARQRISTRAEQAGIDPRRIVFAARIPSRADHLARLTEADLLVDTPIYNSHSSALDALWCQVPILTSRGRSFASRVCASLLDLIGMTETVANSLDEYERIGLQWVTAPDELFGLRDCVRVGVEAARLFDSERYTRRLETALVAMHERRLSGAALSPLTIDSE
jgi:predicted O-linked N-acetylglucosamine transferase (SPINDLY family)